MGQKEERLGAFGGVRHPAPAFILGSQVLFVFVFVGVVSRTLD